MSIPAGTPVVLRVVKFAAGGPDGKSLPVREDVYGADLGWLHDGDVVKVPVSGYRKVNGGNTWVLFEKSPDFVGDWWTMENGHLYPLDPIEPPAPPLEGLVTIEVVEETFKDGKHFMKIRNV